MTLPLWAQIALGVFAGIVLLIVVIFILNLVLAGGAIAAASYADKN